MGLKTAQFKGPYRPIGEVQICRILPNRAIIGLILHRNRKQRFYEFFQIAGEYREENRSSYRACFPPIRMPLKKRGVTGRETGRVAGDYSPRRVIHSLGSAPRVEHKICHFFRGMMK
jgi:hypothetical protein